ncbi:MAG: hypothetical protein HY747_06040, partial [Elusimicrobia bacterium]|nr:hypothetical protein [Elusimicrobiota bacterium]
VLIFVESGSVQSGGQLAGIKKALEKAGYPTHIVGVPAQVRDIENALKKLESKKIKQAICVPLLINSNSEIFERLAYALGKREKPPEYLSAQNDRQANAAAAQERQMKGKNGLRLEMPVKSPVAIDLKQVKTKISTKLVSALDDHPCAAEILLERVRKLSKKPVQEAVAMAAEGLLAPAAQAAWLETGRNVVRRVKEEGGFADCQVFGFSDNAPQAIREKQAAQIRNFVQQQSRERRRVIIVPYLMNAGGFGKSMAKVLSGLFYKIGQEGLMPHPLIEQWVLEQVKNNE